MLIRRPTRLKQLSEVRVLLEAQSYFDTHTHTHTHTHMYAHTHKVETAVQGLTFAKSLVIFLTYIHTLWSFLVIVSYVVSWHNFHLFVKFQNCVVGNSYTLWMWSVQDLLRFSWAVNSNEKKWLIPIEDTKKLGQLVAIEFWDSWSEKHAMLSSLYRGSGNKIQTLIIGSWAKFFIWSIFSPHLV